MKSYNIGLAVSLILLTFVFCISFLGGTILSIAPGGNNMALSAYERQQVAGAFEDVVKVCGSVSACRQSLSPVAHVVQNLKAFEVWASGFVY